MSPATVPNVLTSFESARLLFMLTYEATSLDTLADSNEIPRETSLLRIREVAL